MNAIGWLTKNCLFARISPKSLEITDMVAVEVTPSSPMGLRDLGGGDKKKRRKGPRKEEK